MTRAEKMHDTVNLTCFLVVVPNPQEGLDRQLRGLGPSTKREADETR